MHPKVVRHWHPRRLFFAYNRLKDFRSIAACMHLLAMTSLQQLGKFKSDRYEYLSFATELFAPTTSSNSINYAKVIDIDYENANSINEELKSRSSIADNIHNSSQQFIIIYYTSDKTCTGLLNNTMIHSVQQFINSIESSGKSFRLISIGKIGFYSLRKLYDTSFSGVYYNIDKERQSFGFAFILLDHLMSLDFDKCFLIYNRFITITSQEKVFLSIYSVDFLLKKILIEQQKYDLYKKIATLNKFDDYSFVDIYSFCTSLFIYESLNDNFVSETAYRASTMESIVNNVDILMDFYWRNYQTARQRVITDEIIELVNGASVATEFEIKSNSDN